jgi:catechol 2,3-dioxygenase-like lactoylglutathione lyase family enzyme
MTNILLDHAAIWVEDMDKSLHFFSEIVGWPLHPMSFEVSAENEDLGGMKGVFLDGNGLWLILMHPTGPGPGMDSLQEMGEGAIFELDFEARDGSYDDVLVEMRQKGIMLLKFDGSPVGADGGVIHLGVDVEQGEEIDEGGARNAHWPKELTFGTGIEMYERPMDDKEHLLNQRDEQWALLKPDKKGPPIDHIVIVAEDLERSAKFYTDVLGLKQSPITIESTPELNKEMGGYKGIMIDLNGVYEKTVWLELIQPVGPGLVMDWLKEKGDGAIAEIVAEVDDIEDYYHEMKLKGVELVSFDGKCFEGNKIGYTVKPHNSRIAYFPEKISCGTIISVMQRGPDSTSMLKRRDDLAMDQV